MPYGSGQLIRMSLLRAKPWQRYLICCAMIGGGVLLVAVGHVAGALLAVAGAALGWRMLSYRMRSRSASRSLRPEGLDRAEPADEKEAAG
jgi:hypothetical protein